jgi:hypothetical protein
MKLGFDTTPHVNISSILDFCIEALLSAVYVCVGITPFLYLQ